MTLSRRLRHGVALVLAVAWTVLAVVRFLDFSGEPAPRWQELASGVLAPLTLCIVILNLRLDRVPEQPE